MPAITLPGGFCVAVRSETLARALMAVGRDAGWDHRVAATPSTYLVTDRVLMLDAGQRVGWRRVLVCDPTPLSCRQGLNALSQGKVLGLLLSDDPDELVRALSTTASGCGSVPGRAVEFAAHMPELTDRQAVVVSAVLSGQTNHEIARGLRLSEASVKRELAELYRVLNVPNRLSLAREGLELGFHPLRVLP